MTPKLNLDLSYNKKNCAESIRNLYEILPNYPNKRDCEYAIYLLLNFIEEQEIVRFLTPQPCKTK